MHFIARCCLAFGLISLFPQYVPATMPPVPAEQQVLYPEDEIARRREVINNRIDESEGKGRGKASASATRVVPIPHALPLTGKLEIVSGSTSSFYGKLRRDIKYTIKERFIGNLIITRYYDRATQKYTGREEYGFDTISVEIDASDFKGKVCGKYAGSPPTCTMWQELDLWQAAEGEEYPGKKCNVVTGSSSGKTVSVRINGPDILFLSSQTGQGLKSSCGDSLQKLISRDEFKRMLKQKTIKVKKVLDKTSPGCRPGSTITLEMKIGK